MSRFRSSAPYSDHPRYKRVGLGEAEGFTGISGAPWTPTPGWQELGSISDFQTDRPVEIINGMIARADAPLSYNGRALWFKTFNKTNGIEVNVDMATTLEQPGPVVCVMPSSSATIRGMAFYSNPIFSRYYLVSLGDAYDDRVIYDSQPIINASNPHRATLRIFNDQVAGFINGRAVCGPVDLPAECRSSTRHGWHIGQSTDQQGLIRSFSVNDTVTAALLGTGVTVPAVVSGVGAEVASASSIDVPYPAAVAAGNVLVALVGFSGGGTTTVPSGWTSGGTGSAGLRASILYKVADGTESGNLTVAKSGGSAGVASGIMCKVTGFTNVAGFSGQIGSSAQTNTTTTNIIAPAFTTGTVNSLGLWFAGTGSNNTIAGPTDWTLVGETGTGGQAMNLAIYKRTWTIYPNQSTGTPTGTLGAAVSNFGGHMMMSPGVNLA